MHSLTCPSITGEQESSSSDESVVHDKEVADLLGLSGKHDEFFPVDYNFDFWVLPLKLILVNLLL